MDSQQLATVGKAEPRNAEQMPDRLRRCLTWVQECKRAVSELRSEVKAAISHREKCCMVLSAAMAAVLALESLVYSGNFTNTKEQQLQRLCAKLTSTLDLAASRVKAYGQQSRVQKYCKFFRRQHMLDKFDSTIQQLDEHSEMAWKLQDNDMVLRRRGMRASFTKGPSVYDASLSADSIGPRDSTVLDSADCADTSLLNEAALACCRLRRGTRHNGVRCMVFINPETSSHAGSAGHVWWYISGPVGGNLYKHDLNQGSVQEIEEARKEPPLSVMHHDGQGHVWIGHKRGTLRVWSDSNCAPVCLPMKCFHADIRVIITDEKGTAWVGSDSGNIRRITLKHSQEPDPPHPLFLEVAQTFKRNSTSRTGSQHLHSSSGDLVPNDFARADSAQPGEEAMGSEEGSANGIAGVKAHAGPVTAMELYGGRVFTSGGTQNSSALIEWDVSGAVLHTHDLRDLGVARAIRVVVPGQKSSSLARQHSGDSSNNPSANGASLPGSPGASPPSPLAHQDILQVLTAHDNGQVQVWAMTLGVLKPEYRIGQTGPAARCLVICTGLGIFATAHADGNLNLWILPDRSSANRGSPAVDQAAAAQLKAHRSGMVLAIGANSDIVTCGIFGSIMWWPEAELRSSFEAAGLTLPGEEQSQGTPNTNMSKLLRRYFTPSSAALAQATLQQMHSSGRLQGAESPSRPSALLEESMDLDAQPEPGVDEGAQEEEGPVRAGPPPVSGQEQQQPQQQQQQQLSHQQLQQHQQQQQPGTAASPVLEKLSGGSNAAATFMTQVSRILEEGTARRESTEAMTDKIAHAASLTHLPSVDSGEGSATLSQPPSARTSADTVPPSASQQTLPALTHSTSGALPRYGSAFSTTLRVGTQQFAAEMPGSPSDLCQAPLQQQQWHQQQPQWQQLPTQPQMLQPLVSQSLSGHMADQTRTFGGSLQKTASMDRDSAIRTYVQGIQRSASTNEVSAAVLSSWAVESDSRGAGLQTSESGAISRNSGSSSLGSGIFGDQSSQWVIEYNDLSFRKVIGEGSIGRVHLGRWQETDVAIKVLSIGGAMQAVPSGQGQTAGMDDMTDTDLDDEGSDSELLMNEELAATVRTLEREVAIMSAIRHPNVVLFMGVCLEPPCMVTEFCARGSLFDVLAKARTSALVAQQLDWPKRVGMALDAAKGMLQLHSHKPPILHRDLKSPNLLVDKHWRVKVADFNLSRVMEAQAVVSSISANNPRWLAPEVVTQQHYSKAADVYSFGLILWELLTWQLPWADLGPFQIMIAITEKQRRPEIPAEADLPNGSFAALPGYLQLMEDCWQDDADQRPTFELVIATLRGLLEEAMSTRSQQKAASNKPKAPKAQASQLRSAVPEAAPSAPAAAVAAPIPQHAQAGMLPGTASAPGSALSPFQQPPDVSATLVGASQQHAVPAVQDTAQPPEGSELQQQAAAQQPSATSSQEAGKLPEGMRLQQLQSNLLKPAMPQLQQAAGAALGLADQGPAPSMQPRQQDQTAAPAGNAWRNPFSVHQQPAAQQSLPKSPRSPHQQWHDAMERFHQPGPSQQSCQSQAKNDSGWGNRPGLQTWHEARSSGEARRLDKAAQDVQTSNSITQQRLLDIMGPGASTDNGSSNDDDLAYADWPRPSRHSMSAHPKLLAALRGSEADTSSAMSPFAGFAALSKGRASIDAGDMNLSFTANPGYRARRKSVHIEAVVGRDKVIKHVPKHLRQSLDRAYSDAGRKSSELSAPPPAQSTGMRNSQDFTRPRSLRRTASIPEQAAEQHKLLMDDQQTSDTQHAGLPASSSRCQTAGNDSSTTDSHASTQAFPKSSLGGLNQYSPFAMQEIADAGASNM